MTVDTGITFNDIKAKIKPEDLEVYNSAGLIISASMGTLVYLRDHFEQLFGKGYIYFTISSQPLYLAHWHDLSDAKREEIEAKRRERRNR